MKTKHITIGIIVALTSALFFSYTSEIYWDMASGDIITKRIFFNFISLKSKKRTLLSMYFDLHKSSLEIQNNEIFLQGYHIIPIISNGGIERASNSIGIKYHSLCLDLLKLKITDEKKILLMNKFLLLYTKADFNLKIYSLYTYFFEHGDFLLFDDIDSMLEE